MKQKANDSGSLMSLRTVSRLLRGISSSSKDSLHGFEHTLKIFQALPSSVVIGTTLKFFIKL
jgi:hypothetical protein